MIPNIYYKMDKIIYVTSDGKQFFHSRECEKYCENNGVTFKENVIKVEEKETIKETKKEK